MGHLLRSTLPGLKWPISTWCAALLPSASTITTPLTHACFFSLSLGGSHFPSPLNREHPNSKTHTPSGSPTMPELTSQPTPHPSSTQPNQDRPSRQASSSTDTCETQHQLAACRVMSPFPLIQQSGMVPCSWSGPYPSPRRGVSAMVFSSFYPPTLGSALSFSTMKGGTGEETERGDVPEASANQLSAGEGLHVTVEPLGDAHEGISILSLTRPSARNAIGKQLLRELKEAVNILRQERSTRCVLIRSTMPGVFSTGADLPERASMTQAETLEFVGQLRRVLCDVQMLPMPTIAVVDGLALGSGAELALAADFRVASDSAVFAFPEALLGVMPGAGGTQRLPRIVGGPRAKELIFTAREVNATEAEAMRLVEYRTPVGQAFQKALGLATEITKGAPIALRMTKASVDDGLQVDMATGLRMEEAYYTAVVPTQDRLEGLKAYAEKRMPHFKGE